VSDSNEKTQAANRAAFIAAARKYLAPGREQVCEMLGDLMLTAIQSIGTAANIEFKPPSDLPADTQRVLEQCAPQILQHIVQHTEHVAHTAIHVLTNVYVTTLRVASGATPDDPTGSRAN
jgi:hypothetical protein